MQITHQDVFQYMEQWAPKSLAYDWDPVGLQSGSYVDETEKILVSLDVTEAVVDEAMANGCNLIIAHHPLLFTSLSSLDTDSLKGKIIKKLVKHDITVYAAHTNLDIASGGVNDILSDKLGVRDTSPLIPTSSETLLKLVVFTPQTHTESIREGLGEVGAGFIGAYSHCTYQTAGTGSFKPLEGTDPYIGEKGSLTFVEEDRLETIIKEKDVTAIMEKLKTLHPYEEVAYDLYAVQQTALTYGLGRIGMLPEAVPLESLGQHVKEKLDIPHLRLVGKKDTRIKSVAIIGGSGEKYIHEARNKGADVLITGDVTFHPAQDAMEEGFSIIDAGHYIEKWMKQAVKQYLHAKLPTMEVLASEVNTDPFCSL